MCEHANGRGLTLVAYKNKNVYVNSTRHFLNSLMHHYSPVDGTLDIQFFNNKKSEKL